MLFSTLMLIFGTLVVISAVALASDTDMLQPASTITYNEDLTVNGTGRFNSVQIGAEGVGGVTYFNGTIVNVGETVPVTFGDDVRIDGEIWRGTSKGVGDGMPIKVSDTMVPTLDDINDLGWPQQRWQNIYYSQNLLGNNANFNGNLTLQPAGSNPRTNIKISANDPISLGILAGLNQNFKGIYHSSNIQNKELSFGEFRVKNFIESGTDVKFLGLTGYDRSRSQALLFGFAEDVNSNFENQITLAVGDISGQGKARLNISSDNLYLSGIKGARFKEVGTLTETPEGCKSGGDIIQSDSLVYGDTGSGNGLYLCMGNQLYEIDLTPVP